MAWVHAPWAQNDEITEGYPYLSTAEIPQIWNSIGQYVPWELQSSVLEGYPYLKNTAIPQKWSTDGHQTPWTFNSNVLEGYPYLKNTAIPLSLETCNMYYGETKPTKLMYGTRQVVAAYCSTIEVYRY